MTADRHARLATARLYYVSASLHALEGALRGGADLFQLRMKDARDDAVLAAAEEARALCHRHGALFLLNDRPDLARAVGADGVHVGQDDEPVAAARAAVGTDRVVGRSTHAPEQLAASPDADYVAVGPVHATPTKPGRPAAGLDYVRHAAAHAGDQPWFAIGGIDEQTVGDVVDAGARRIVVVRVLDEADDPERTARALRAALDRAPVGRAA
ncbi:thiamine phosphate synthase [Conexibacter sp. SYSU D00693]|uniref:thiamine phosphate synthase n=1 Tax=Conexibacter sp. SYSU D00693 TaxID=2812560 RepID=UPI001F120AE0|nr:thiamine phosphate synthase [Conexibacter sp. SYSU D00693]